LLTALQYRLLRKIAPAEPHNMADSIYEGKSKLKMTLGDVSELIRGKTVIDFGCGEGLESVDLVQRGAANVIGIDIRESVLAKARANARAAGVGERCEFTTATSAKADIIISLDGFEHFADPAAVLATMGGLLKPGGIVLVSFGWTWYHPLGGHLFSVFPWAHLVFSEKALIRWRSHIRSDGATRFGEVEGGLNQMTIARFERLVAASPLKLDRLEPVPIRKLRLMHCRLTREFTTALVRAKLSRN
jgi:SAM-dependent methyltransferase